MTTDPRIEAAAKALNDVWDEPVDDNARLVVRDVLAAADAVMFSEENIERACIALWNRTMSVDVRNDVRAVVDALRGGGS